MSTVHAVTTGRTAAKPASGKLRHIPPNSMDSMQSKFNLMKTFTSLIIAAVVCVGALPAFSQSSIMPDANAQRSQLVLGGLSGTEFPFVNMVKISPNFWVCGNNAHSCPTPANVDANGYPLYDPSASAHNGWNIATTIPNQMTRPGHYVLEWAGAAEMNAKEPAGLGGGSFTTISCTGRNLSGAGIADCSNLGCTALTGSISGTILTVTVASTWTGPGSANCNIVVGQPISGDGITVSQWGTPTIVTGMSGSSNCQNCTGKGRTGSYLINFSQNVSSRTIAPGGRVELLDRRREWWGHEYPDRKYRQRLGIDRLGVYGDGCEPFQHREVDCTSLD